MDSKPNAKSQSSMKILIFLAFTIIVVINAICYSRYLALKRQHQRTLVTRQINDLLADSTIAEAILQGKYSESVNFLQLSGDRRIVAIWKSMDKLEPWRRASVISAFKTVRDIRTASLAKGYKFAFIDPTDTEASKDHDEAEAILSKLNGNKAN